MAKKKKTIAINKSRITYVGENLMIQELDKDGEVCNELSLLDVVNEFIDLDNVSITIGQQVEI